MAKVAGRMRQAAILAVAIGLLVSSALASEPKNYDGWTDLHWAAAKGDDRLVAALAGPGRVDVRNAMGRTPLYEAAKRGQLAAVRTLLEHGADVNAAEGLGFTPLHIAAEQNQVAVMKLLLARGARVDARNKKGQTPLWQLSWQRHQDTAAAALLIASGAKVDASDDSGWTPIHMAALDNDVQLVRLLLAKGADPNQPNADSPTWGPLHSAAKSGAVLTGKTDFLVNSQ